MLFKQKTILLLITLLILFSPVSKTSARDLANVLTGDQIIQDMLKNGITPEKANNSINSLEGLLQNNILINNEDQILYTLAKYKIYLGLKYKETDYVKKHISDYVYFESGDYYVYKGNDLNKLIEEYPSSHITDDAAFLLASLPDQYEGEGDIVYYLQNDLKNFKGFILKFHKSPYLINALTKINNTLLPLKNDEFISELDQSSIQKVLPLVDEYYQLIKSIKNKEKVYALHLLAQVYKKLGNIQRSREIYSELIKEYPDYEKYNNVNNEYSMF